MLELFITHQLFLVALAGAVENGLGSAVLHFLELPAFLGGFLKLSAGEFVSDEYAHRARFLSSSVLYNG